MGASTLALSSYLAHAISRGERTVFLPGETTDGHYQIEQRCELCHSEAFSDAAAIQEGCVGCHGEELRQVEDSHPRSKFTDPRNADRVAVLDARYCATCHREHAPRATSPMGLTLPGDYCFHCHQGIGEERPSHAGLPYSGCADSGCHNFHDNTSLYEDFLTQNAGAPDLLPELRAPLRGPTASFREPLVSLGAIDAPAAPEWRPDPVRLASWNAAIHGRAGVNCSDCHAPTGEWSFAVSPSVCGDCHETERSGFEASRHGMRSAAELTPMHPLDARLPMRDDASSRALDCSACHAPHFFETSDAATEACLGCHADEHSLAFEDSPHARWRPDPDDDERRGERISCATCHLPRVQQANGRVRTIHNQNANLRPSDKMARTVCMQCHGLRFTIDSLADRELALRNFAGSPSRHVPSMDWAAQRLARESNPPIREGTP